MVLQYSNISDDAHNKFKYFSVHCLYGLFVGFFYQLASECVAKVSSLVQNFRLWLLIGIWLIVN